MEAIKIQGIGAIRRASSSFPSDPIIRANILETIPFLHASGRKRAKNKLFEEIIPSVICK